MSEHIEVELKFDVDAGLPVPDLTALPGIVRTSGPLEENLDATYFDTETLDLTDNRITLRRRTGGHDAGWHLKRPGTGRARRELQIPAGSTESIPPALLDPVRAHVRDRPLMRIAAVSTRRLIYEARDAHDTVRAVLCADVVTACSLLPGGVGRTWSEWEFELVPGSGADLDLGPDGADDPDASATVGDVELLDAADSLLRAAGARSPSSASKLVRTIGATPAHSSERRLSSSPTALELVMAELTRHRDQLIAFDPGVRADEPDAVHQMRVATRRLRSVLRAFPTVIGSDVSTRLQDELKELAVVLGAARDAEVSAQRYRHLLDGERASDVLRERLIDDQIRRYRRGRRTSAAAMTTIRYYRLLDEIDVLLVRPHPGPDADRLAATMLRDAVSHSRRAVRRARRKVRRLPVGSPEWTEQLHTVRKKAKRLRYVAEAGSTLGVRRHRSTASAAKKIQSTLGDANDAALSRDVLLGVLGVTTSPADAFVLGRLDAREQAAQERALRRYEEVSGRV